MAQAHAQAASVILAAIGGAETVCHLITGNALSYAIIIAVALAVACIAAIVLRKDADERPAATTAAQEAPVVEKIAAINAPGILASPMTGEAFSMTDAPDPLFASLAMGDGTVVRPTEGTVYAPVSGTIDMVNETEHAIGLVSDDGIEVLIHIGIDTVELRGTPFVMHVSQFERVEAGQLLVEADLEAIEAAGKDTATMVIVTNSNDFSSVEPRIGTVKAGEKLITVAK